jgi:hypothetical protein
MPPHDPATGRFPRIDAAIETQHGSCKEFHRGEGMRVTIERRNNQRTPFDGWVELHVDGVRRLASGRDLSASGIGLELAGHPLAPPLRVTCEFALPGISLPLEIDGCVAWGDGSQLGVRFDAIDPGLAELLDNHVAGRF